MIEYIAGHYAWFLGAIILILLAVLGYYADKTNFGQKKIDKKNKKDGITEIESKEENIETLNLETSNKDVNNQEVLIVDEVKKEEVGPVLQESVEETIKASIPSDIDKIEQAEDSFNKISQQIESLLPERDIINVDLLEDIDELELGKTRKLDFNLVPDLDDIDLPKIKKLVDEEQDIWKF